MIGGPRGSRRWSRRAARFALLPLSAVLLGCPQHTGVRVLDGSTASDLRFQVWDRSNAERPLLTPIGVVRPGGPDEMEERLWGIVPGDRAVDPVPVFRFGEVPPGFVAYLDAPATADVLPTGCYEVRITGTGRSYFEVLDDGSVAVREERCESD